MLQEPDQIPIQSRRPLGVMMLVTASVLWSISGVAVKVLQLPPVAFTVYRSIGAAFAMGVMTPLLAGGLPPLKRMVVSATLYTVVVALLITSMTRSTAAAGILLQYTAPIWCGLFAWMFARRAPGGRTLLALGVSIVGIGVMIYGQPREQGWVGPGCGLLSGIAFGGLILILSGMSSRNHPVNPAIIVLFNNLGVVLLLTPVGLWFHMLEIPAGKAAVVIGIGIIQLAVPYLLFQLSLRHVMPVDASLLTLLEPVLNPVWVALATTERPDLATLIGGGAIIIALVIEATKPAD